MADRSGGTISIRLSVKDGEAARAALRAFGAEGERAIKQLDDAAKKPTPALLAVNSAIKNLRGTAEGWASRGGAFGAGLSALGPAGIAAAAGIGIGAAAITSLTREAIQAGERLGALKDQAETAGVSIETLQGLRGLGLEAGVSLEKVNSALDFFVTGVGQAAEGQGKLYSALKDSNPELLSQIRNAQNQEQALRAVAAALAATTSETERANIARAAFGKGGLDLGRALQQAGGDIDGLVERLKQGGLILSEDWVQRGDDFSDRIAVASARIQNEMTPTLVRTGEGMATVAEGAADLATAVNSVDSIKLANILALFGNIPGVGAVSSAIGAITGYGADGIVDTERRARAGMFTPAPVVPLPQAKPKSLGLLSDEDFARQREEAERKATEAQRASEKAMRSTSQAAREQEQILRQAARTKLELGDITGALAVEERELAEQVAAGAITQQEATRALALRKKELIETAESMRDSPAWDAIRGIGSSLKDAFRGIKDDLQENVSFWDAIGNAVSRVKDRVLDLALNSGLDMLFGGGKSSGGSGILGSLISGFFGGGGSSPLSMGSASIPGVGHFSGLRAGGGQVVPGGWYRVNEAEEEFFSPSVPGRVGPSGGRGQILVENHIHNNASGVSVREEQRETSSGLRLDTFIEMASDRALQKIGSGQGDKPMRRFGIRPETTRRV